MVTNTPNYTGAGVLPYYYSKNDDQVYYLIGKENGVWADFGGKKNPGERASTTAVREMNEESIGTLRSLETPIKKSMQKTAKVFNSKYGYAMYVSDATSVPGIKNVRVNFRAKRFPGNGLHHSQKEKTDMGWVRAADLTKSIVNRRANWSRPNKLSEKFTVYATPSSTAQVVEKSATLRPSFAGGLDRVVHFNQYPKANVNKTKQTPHQGSLLSGLKHFHGCTIKSND